MTELKSHATKPMICPSCGKVNDQAIESAPDFEAPGPGSVLICLYCAQASMLTHDMVMRSPTIEEMLQLLADEGFVRAAVAAFCYLSAHPPTPQRETRH